MHRRDRVIAWAFHVGIKPGFCTTPKPWTLRDSERGPRDPARRETEAESKDPQAERVEQAFMPVAKLLWWGFSR
jgi:hypothetical protein